MIDTDFDKWLSNTSAPRVLLFDADYYDPDQQQVSTLRLSHNLYTGAAKDAFASLPSYKLLVREVPQLNLSLPDQFVGAAKNTSGDIIIDNSGGVRDHWLDYGFDGRRLVIRIGSPDWPLADFKIIFTGYVADIAAPTGDTLSLKIRDALHALNDPIQGRLIGEPERIDESLTCRLAWSPIEDVSQVFDRGNPIEFSTNLYAGTITLTHPPVGRVTAIWRGGDSDTPTRNTPVPLAYGTVFNAEPVLVDSGLHLYRVHDGPIHRVISVMDNGFPVDFTPDLNSGVVRLTRQPFGRVTVSLDGAIDHNQHFLTSAAQIIRHIILTRSDLAETDLDQEAFDLFGALRPEPVSIYISERTNILEVIGQLAASVGGFVAPRRNGRITLRPLDLDPDDQSIRLSLSVHDIVYKGGIALKQRILPVSEISLGYRQNYTPLGSNDIAGYIVDPDRSDLMQPCRRVYINNSRILVHHADAQKPKFSVTRLVSQCDAEKYAQQQIMRYGRLRQVFSVTCRARPATLELGDVIHLTCPRYGFDVGRKAVVVGVRGDISQPRHVLEVLL